MISEPYQGMTSGGYVRDVRQLNPPLPDGTQMMIVTYMVVENGVWRYQKGFSKVTTVAKATTQGQIKAKEKQQKSSEFKNLKLGESSEEDW